MKRGSNLQQDLLRQTGEAFRRDLAHQGEIVSGPPRPGDVFLLRETADHGLEWVVVEAEGGGRLFVVPADTHPLIGSADLEISADSAPGPLSLRFRYGLSLGVGAFDPRLRTGCLAPEDLVRVRARRSELESGNAVASADAREVDSDPEYHEWQETLAAACTALSRHAQQSPDLARPIRSPWWALRQPLATAASVLLILALGFTAGSFFERRGKEVEQELHPPEPVVDVPWTVLFRGTDRSEGGELLTVTAGARWLALLLERPTAGPESGGARLEIRRRASDRIVWSTSLEEKDASEEILVLVPRDLLPPGEYRLRLLAGEAAEPVARYALRIEWQ